MAAFPPDEVILIAGGHEKRMKMAVRGQNRARAWLLARRVAKVRVGRRSIRGPESEVARIIREGFVPARKERQ